MTTKVQECGLRSKVLRLYPYGQDPSHLWELSQWVNGEWICIASGYATARDEGYMMAEEEAVRLGTSGRISGDEANGYHFGPPLVVAEWNAEQGQYVAEGGDWLSHDGDQWVSKDGHPLDAAGFNSARIRLVGGSRDGEIVG